jgi:hypothetical protein
MLQRAPIHIRGYLLDENKSFTEILNKLGKGKFILWRVTEENGKYFILHMGLECKNCMDLIEVLEMKSGFVVNKLQT